VPALQAGGQRFKSSTSHQLKIEEKMSTEHYTFKEIYQRDGYWIALFCFVMYFLTLDFLGDPF
jgi:hypothetical protein